MEKGSNCALTVGIPNVGKSSSLMCLMRGSGAPFPIQLAIITLTFTSTPVYICIQ